MYMKCWVHNLTIIIILLFFLINCATSLYSLFIVQPVASCYLVIFKIKTLTTGGFLLVIFIIDLFISTTYFHLDYKNSFCNYNHLQYLCSK